MVPSIFITFTQTFSAGVGHMPSLICSTPHHHDPSTRNFDTAAPGFISTLATECFPLP